MPFGGSFRSTSPPTLVMVRTAVDSPPPPPPFVSAPAPADPAPAATDYQPRSKREAELCDRAGSFDWLYMGALLLADVGTVYLDGNWFKDDQRPVVRTIGPGLVGFTWGWTLGAIYPSLPKCSPTWIAHAPPEGDVYTSTPYAIAMTIIAGITAPILVGVETGPPDYRWLLGERMARVFVSAGTGVIGSLMPYILPPKTLRAARELEKIRAGGDGQSVFIGYRFQF